MQMAIVLKNSLYLKKKVMSFDFNQIPYYIVYSENFRIILSSRICACYNAGYLH